MDKLFIQPAELLEDSFKLAWQVYESGYRPNYIIGVWRGCLLYTSDAADE